MSTDGRLKTIIAWGAKLIAGITEKQGFRLLRHGQGPCGLPRGGNEIGVSQLASSALVDVDKRQQPRKHGDHVTTATYMRKLN